MKVVHLRVYKCNQFNTVRSTLSSWSANSRSLSSYLGLRFPFSPFILWSMNSGCLAPNRNSWMQCCQIVDHCQLWWVGEFQSSKQCSSIRIWWHLYLWCLHMLQLLPIYWSNQWRQEGISFGQVLLGGVPLCPCPTARKAMGLRPISMLLMA